MFVCDDSKYIIHFYVNYRLKGRLRMTLNDEEYLLKSRLKNFGQKEFSFLECSVVMPNCIESLLNNIGTIDSELRDNLIYMTFARWITSGQLSVDIMLHIKNTIMDTTHMFYRIGEKNNDTVFTRSFSVLFIPLLLERNKQQAFMQPNELTEIQEKILLYIKEEKDLRGFVENKGWAHALAHTADAIHAISVCNHLSAQQSMRFLDAIKNAICTKQVVYTNLEEERLVTAVVSLIAQNKLSDKEIENWISRFLIWDKTEVWNEEYKIIFNIKSFLGSLYFRIHKRNEFSCTARVIEDRLHTFMQSYIS